MLRGQTVEDLEKPIERVYWRIGQVADELGVAPSHVRFLEEAYCLTCDRRSHAGNRMYTRIEADRIKAVYGLTLYFHGSVVKDLLANKELDLEALLLDIQRMVLK